MTTIRGGELVCPKCHSRWVARLFPRAGIYECLTCNHQFTRAEGIKASYKAVANQTETKEK